MQLREKLDFSSFRNTKTAILKIMLPLFAFIVITVASWGIWLIVRNNGIFGPRLTDALTLVFTIMMFLFIIFTTYSMTKNLYFAFDNQILFTLPVSNSQVFLSKLIVFYINEFKRSLIFIVPIFIGFGIVNNFSIGFYFILPLVFIIISLIPIVISAFLSIPLLFIALLLKRFSIVQYILAASVAGVAIVFFFIMTNAIPENFDFFGNIRHNLYAIRAFLAQFANIFFFFDFIVQLATGYINIQGQHIPATGQGAAIFFITLAILANFLTIAFFIIRPLYFWMVSKHRENQKNENKRPKRNTKLTSFVSILKKESLLRFRTPSALVHTLFGVFFLPLSIFLLNRLFGALNTRLLGDMVALTANFLLLILILTTQHVRAASIFSNEGKAVYILKTTPDTVRANIAAKMLLDSLLSMISLIVTSIIISRSNNLPSLIGALIFFSVFLLAIGHICWSIEMDITNPQYLKIIDGVHETSNSNETKSLIIAIIISFIIPAVATLLTLQYGFERIHFAWLTVFGISLAFVAFRFYLLVQNVKVYFKEM